MNFMLLINYNINTLWIVFKMSDDWLVKTFILATLICGFHFWLPISTNRMSHNITWFFSQWVIRTILFSRALVSFYCLGYEGKDENESGEQIGEQTFQCEHSLFLVIFILHEDENYALVTYITIQTLNRHS